MPIYEYLCGECTHTLDALQKLSDDPLVYCPQCGAAALKRQMSAPSFRLKGGGWYETDFKSDKRRNISEGDSKSPDAKPADKPADTPADKPAAKADKPAATESKKADAGTAAVKKPEAGKAGGVV
jgi:putative FmdB family regulatory protein